jgi:quinoprotein dehydrogenase-associated probable ABC transporter substrate-binding protein
LLLTSALSVCVAAGPTLASDNGTIVYTAPLRVCADPDNLPYSNRAGQGFENKLAEMAAKDLGTTVSYTWFPQRSGFLRNTLDAGECDVVMGIPDVGGVDATRSYYRSGYVFVSRMDRGLTLSSMRDPALRTLRIGVPLVGADGAGTPPAVALGMEGITDNVEGFPVYGDGPQEQAAAPIEAVANKTIDIAAVWGPIGGYYAAHLPVPMRVTPISDTTDFLPQTFEFPISMAVRTEDDDLKDRLDAFIRRNKAEIAALLTSYGVPLL